MDSKKPHVLAFPYPGKGHIHPMSHFSNYLTSMGIDVTMIHTTSTIKSVKSIPDSLIRVEVVSHEEIFDKVKEDDVESHFNVLKENTRRGLSKVIDKYVRLQQTPIDIVLCDSTMPWLLEVAHGYGISGVSFFTQSLSVSALCYHMLAGTIQKNCDTTVIVPGMPEIQPKDLPDSTLGWDTKMVVRKHMMNQFSNIDKFDWILFNTFDALEDEVAEWMASKWRVKTIGPLALTAYTHNQNKPEDGNNVYLSHTNFEACLKWLDTKETSSVVYVSFGSIVRVREEQLVQVARGLVKSGCEFLWAVRREEQPKLPPDFMTSEKGAGGGGRGLVVNWCPQFDVLAHKAIGCFMTHCGWNSTLEAISLGVPMIALPQFTDQVTNGKFIEEVWCMGVRGQADENRVVTSEEIERCIVEMVKTEKGKDRKRNAMKWMQMAKEAVEEGGSSTRNMHDFVSWIFNKTV